MENDDGNAHVFSLSYRCHSFIASLSMHDSLHCSSRKRWKAHRWEQVKANRSNAGEPVIGIIDTSCVKALLHLRQSFQTFSLEVGIGAQVRP